MAEPSDNIGLRSDSALTDPEDDELGYKHFAEDLADTVNNKVPSDDFVIGIYGQWGSGKSTILNYIEYYLEQKETPPLIIRFNPWWFSGQADLFEKYFSELEAGLGIDSDFDEARNQIARFSDALSKVPSSATGGVPVGGLSWIISKILQKEPANIDEIKDGISDGLNESDRRIVVMIDDIDRLSEDEIKQMFRLVKSVANFPNLTYVLAFDQMVVIEALEDEQGINNGEDYLDKIIQLPQHIPVPEENSLQTFFLQRLERIIGKDELIFEESRWQLLYRDAISSIIQTPRDAVRLSNAVDSLYSRIGGDVNFVDLVAIEALRVFYRPTYEEIRENPEKFIIQQRSRPSDEDNDYTGLWEGYGERERERVKTVLGNLFPRIEEGRHTIRTDTSEYRKQRRICHGDIFPFYVRQTVPHGELSLQEIESMLSVSSNPEEFAEKLDELSELEGKEGRSKANTFLKRFEDYTDKIPLEEIETVTTGFFLAGDCLIKIDPSESTLDDGSDGPLLRIIWSLVKRLDRDERSSILARSIPAGRSAYFPTFFIGVMMQEHGEYGGTEIEESRRTFSYSQIKKLQQITVDKIEEMADKGKLLKAPNPIVTVSRWNEWSDDEKPKQWAEETADDDENLMILLESLIQQGRTTTAGGKTTVTDYINPKQLEPFLDVSSVEQKLNQIPEEELSESERYVLEKFREGKERMDRGADPGDFGSWSINEKRGLNS